MESRHQEFNTKYQIKHILFDTSKFQLWIMKKDISEEFVFSGPLNTCQSKSVPILLTRFHKIKNNSVQSDQTICSGDVPFGFVRCNCFSTGGTGHIHFCGNKSPSGTASWTNAIGTNTTGNYGLRHCSILPGTTHCLLRSYKLAGLYQIQALQ